MAFVNFDTPSGGGRFVDFDAPAPIPATIEDKPFSSDAYEVGRQLVGGLVTRAPEMVGSALEWWAPQGSSLEDMGRVAKDYWAKKEADWQPDMEGRGPIASTLIQGAGQLAPSALGMAAAATNPYVGGALIAGLFGGQQAQSTYDKAIEAGLPDSEASSAAYKTGLIEGFGETIADVTGAKLLTGSSKLLSGLAGVDGSVKAATSPKWAAKFAKDWAANAVIQSSTEFGQNYGEAKVEQNAGLPTDSPVASGMQGAQAALGMSVLLGPLGVVGGVSSAQQRAKIGAALNDETAPPEVRMAAAQYVANDITPIVGKEKADAWLKTFHADVAAPEQSMPAATEKPQDPAIPPSEILDAQTADDAIREFTRNAEASTLEVPQDQPALLNPTEASTLLQNDLPAAPANPQPDMRNDVPAGVEVRNAAGAGPGIAPELGRSAVVDGGLAATGAGLDGLPASEPVQPTGRAGSEAVAPVENRDLQTRAGLVMLAANLAEKAGKISISNLRRQYPQINESAAARILDQLQNEGVIGPVSMKTGSHEFIGGANAQGATESIPQAPTRNGSAQVDAAAVGANVQPAAENAPVAVQPDQLSGPILGTNSAGRITLTGIPAEQIKSIRDKLGLKGVVIGNSQAVFPAGTNKIQLERALGISALPQDVILADGENPYKSQGAALLDRKAKGLNKTHLAQKIDGGFALVPRAAENGAAPTQEAAPVSVVPNGETKSVAPEQPALENLPRLFVTANIVAVSEIRSRDKDLKIKHKTDGKSKKISAITAIKDADHRVKSLQKLMDCLA